MSSAQPYRHVDLEQLGEIRRAERPPLHIRWWVLPLAVVLCSAQSVLCLVFENVGTTSYAIATQISVVAFGFLVLVTFLLNPLLRLTHVVEPLNRGEVMAVFAAMSVSAGITTFGMANQLIPLVVAPFNSHWNIPQRQWDQGVIRHLKHSLFITDSEVIDQFRVGFDTREGLWRKIPWLAWAKPLGLWMIFVLAVYFLFYSLSTLLYDSWARREKLVFPLARLPEDLMHDEGAPAGSFPSALRTSTFWIGFLLVFGLLGFNGACQAGWIRGLSALRLGIEQGMLQKMLQDTLFNGIADGGRIQLIIMITFTAVGIGFLLPLDISRSLWVYTVIALAMTMIAIWCAVASSTRAFTSDWLWENNFASSLGSGGLLAFSATCLGKLVHERWATTRERRPELAGAPLVGRFLLSFGSGGLFFLISVGVTLAWLWWSGVGPHWGFLFLAVVILITIGLMRVVAEGGVYWFQVHTGPFHLVKMLGGVKVVPAAVVAPLMAIYSILFLDIKTYMAPAVLNSYKMQEETRASRRMFHLIVVAAILATVVTALTGMLYVIYEIGANRGSHWFFTSGPQRLLDQTQRLVSGALAETGRTNWIFYLLGAGWVILSIFMRRRFFWWLHPIGFVMLANPLTYSLWFSFFLGWLCKRITVRYGGRHMFAKVRPFFIGLILGEVLAVFVWMLLKQVLDSPDIFITLNKRTP